MGYPRYLLLLVLGVFCYISGPAPTVASEADGSDSSGLIAPIFRDCLEDVYSTRPTVENWAALSFTITKNGDVTDIELIDGFVSPEFDFMAKHALNQCRFKPAELDGVKIDWHNYRISSVYVQGKNRAHSEDESFKPKYDEISTLVDQGQFQEALKKIGEFSSAIAYLQPYVLIHIKLFQTELGLNNVEAARRAMLRATLNLRAGPMPWKPETYPTLFYPGRYPEYDNVTGSTLQPKTMKLPERWDSHLADALVDALKQRLKFETELHRYTDSIGTFELLRELRPAAIDGDIQAIQDANRKIVASIEPIIVHGQVYEGRWDYGPARRRFAVANVQGSISELIARCNAGDTRIDLTQNRRYDLPPSLGQCELDFIGTEGTRFEVTEYHIEAQPE